MISPPSAQEAGTISRRLEHKSFISKPLEGKTRFIAFADGRVTRLARRLTRQAVPRLRPFTRLPRFGDPSEPGLAPQTSEPLARDSSNLAPDPPADLTGASP